MILIADSGSTKTDWRIFDNNEVVKGFQTAGYNPYYQSTQEISDDLKVHFRPFVEPYKIDQIYYYGTGCSTKERKDTVRKAIIDHVDTGECEVEGDLLGAARAACQHEYGIACILGTGSGSCVFDGQNIVETVPSLGFILGDEGSGAYIGKKLVTDFLREDMPDHLVLAMKEEYGLTKEIVLENVNQKPMPSRYLARFSKFLYDYLAEEYVISLVRGGLGDFVKQYILRYDSFNRYPVSFVGSISYYFKSVLEDLSRKNNFTLGRIIKSPVEGLVEYHKK